jgi:hypothetical protein
MKLVDWGIEVRIGVLTNKRKYPKLKESVQEKLMELDFVTELVEPGICNTFIVVCFFESFDEATPEVIDRIKKNILKIVE